MRRAIHCALLLLMITFSRHGISQASGSVRGTVVDPTGAGVPGASIQVLAAHGAPISESVTDSQGAFAILNLPRGNLFLVVPPFLGFSERRIRPLQVHRSHQQRAAPTGSGGNSGETRQRLYCPRKKTGCGCLRESLPRPPLLGPLVRVRFVAACGRPGWRTAISKCAIRGR